jgi:hypothetical protein
MKSNAIYFSRFNRDENGGGGKRRTVQLYEILSKKIECEFVSELGFSKDQLTPVKPKKKLFGVSSESKLASYWEKSFVSVFHQRKKVSQLFIEKTSIKTKLVFIDDPLYYESFVDFCNMKAIAVIALVHNIESLVPGHVKKDKKNALFCKEIEILQKCTAVITIAREDHLLLTNFGILSFFIPYYPVESIKARLLQIRKERERNPKQDLLLLGTMKNRSTLIGTLNFVKKYVGECFAKHYGKIYIGGFGAAQIQNFITNPDVIIKSDLSNQEHDHLLKTVKACVCYQDQGSGALTKIPEYLIAGIPVLSNTIAARNYYNLDGIVLFDTPEAFYKAVKKIEQFDKNGIAMPEFDFDLGSFFTFTENFL